MFFVKNQFICKFLKKIVEYYKEASDSIQLENDTDKKCRIIFQELFNAKNNSNMFMDSSVLGTSKQR